MSDAKRIVRCAIYTRKSTEEGLEQDFNTFKPKEKRPKPTSSARSNRDGARFRTATMMAGSAAPASRGLPWRNCFRRSKLEQVDCVVVYKVDRLSRSLLDFARLLSLFERHDVSFVSVTQDFNTTTSMGRLTLNILLSFAQFEREIISERTRDKLSAARRKGKWTGGNPVLGYDIDPGGGRLLVNQQEAERVREISLDLCPKRDDRTSGER